MDTFPEELKIPPVPSILIVGCPELHSQLETFFSKTLRPALHVLRKTEDKDISSFFEEDTTDDNEGQLATGMVDMTWMRAFKTFHPVVIVVFIKRSDVESDPARWTEVMNIMQEIKECCDAYLLKLVVVFVSDEMKELPLELISTFQQRFGLEEQSMLSLLAINVDPNDTSVMQLANNELKSIGQMILEKAWLFYKEYGDRIVDAASQRTNSISPQKVLDNCNLAFLAEFQQDWTSAVTEYTEAYRRLIELLRNSPQQLHVMLSVEWFSLTRSLFLQNQLLLEALYVSEFITMKICGLLTHQQRIDEAWKQFHHHLSSFRIPTGALKNGLLAFFLGWLSRQYEIMLDVLNQKTGTQHNLLSVSITSRRHLANLYFCAAEAAVRQRRHMEVTLKQLNSDKVPIYDFVIPSRFWGQFQLKSDDTLKPIPEEVLDGYLFAVETSKPLQERSIQLLQTCLSHLKHARITRKAAHVSALLAEEQLASGEVHAARENLLRVADTYRKNGWNFPLSSALRLLIDISAESFWEKAVYSLELATLNEVADIADRSTFAKSGIEILVAERSEIAQSKLWESDSNEIEQLPRSARVKGDLKDNGWSSVIEIVCGFESVNDNNDYLHFGVAVKNNLPVPLPIDSMAVHFLQHKGQSRAIKFTEAKSIYLKTGQWREFTESFVPTTHGEIRAEFVEIFFGVHASLTWHLRLSNKADEGHDDVELLTERLPFRESVISPGLHSVRVKHIGASPTLTVIGPRDVYHGEKIAVSVEVSCEAEFRGESLRLDLSCDNSMGNPQWTDTGSSVHEEKEIHVSVSSPWTQTCSILVHSFGTVTIRAALRLNPETVISQILSFEVKEPFFVEAQILSPPATYMFLPSPYKSEPDPLMSEHAASKPAAVSNTVCIAEAADAYVSVAIRCKADCELFLTEANYQFTKQELMEIVAVSGPVKDAIMNRGDVYKTVFKITPKGSIAEALASSLALTWRRKESGPCRRISRSLSEETVCVELPGEAEASESRTICRLQSVTTQKPLLVAKCQPPGPVQTGQPFPYVVQLGNQTTLPEEFNISVIDAFGCLFSGNRVSRITIDPFTKQTIRWECVAYSAGNIKLPKVRIASPRLKCYVEMEGFVVFAQPTSAF